MTTVVSTSTFESGAHKPEWDAALNPTKGTRSNIDVITDLAEQGTHACRIVIHPDDTFQPYNQNRVELHHSSKQTAVDAP